MQRTQAKQGTRESFESWTKEIGCYCSFYTEHEPNFLAQNFSFLQPLQTTNICVLSSFEYNIVDLKQLPGPLKMVMYGITLKFNSTL